MKQDTVHEVEDLRCLSLMKRFINFSCVSQPLCLCIILHAKLSWNAILTIHAFLLLSIMLIACICEWSLCFCHKFSLSSAHVFAEKFAQDNGI